MNFNNDDEIVFLDEVVKHKSAGGFVFYEDSDSHELFVALLKKDTGEWMVPKGHIKKGETPQRAAIREIKEELSLKNEPLDEVAFLSEDSYTFKTKGDNRLHSKKVHFYVYKAEGKFDIKPFKEEGFVEAQWVPFEAAISRITFDKENLLHARQVFYYEREVKKYNSLSDVPSITIAIPTHNGGETLVETLNSVISELESLKIRRKEIVVCSDHCTDNTRDILQEYIAKQEFSDIKIRLLDNSDEKGKSIVLNHIYANTNGDFFCVVDDDVVLRKRVIVNLLDSFVKDEKLRIAFSSWKRKEIKSSNPWKRFWYWILGIKFDIEVYKKPSELVRGACLMMHRDDFIYLPNVLNEDQFFQYMYWPNTGEVKYSVLLFNSVASVTDYYKRFVRIAIGNKQIISNFSVNRVSECRIALRSEIDKGKLLRLPFTQLVPYTFYRIIRYLISLMVYMKIKSMNNYEWFRFK